jgi:hypothetical protein
MTIRHQLMNLFPELTIYLSDEWVMIFRFDVGKNPL